MFLLVPMQFRHQALWDAARLKGHSKPTTDTEGPPLHYKERLNFAIKTKKNITKFDSVVHISKNRFFTIQSILKLYKPKGDTDKESALNVK